MVTHALNSIWSFKHLTVLQSKFSQWCSCKKALYLVYHVVMMSRLSPWPEAWMLVVLNIFHSFSAMYCVDGTL